MSKGPGKWQRRLLLALEEQPAVFLADLLKRPYPRAHYVALHRAASVLADSGQVDIHTNCLAGGVNSMWVTRPGYSCNRSLVPRPKC